MNSDTIVVVSASIGAGHDGAARELGRRLTANGFAVTHHDFLDLLRPGLGSALRGTYARQLRYAPGSWGRLLHAAATPRGIATATGLAVAAASSRMLAAVAGGPAAVVSTYPLASQVLGQLRRSGRLTAPVLAMMTDPAVHPLCVSPGVDMHLACNLEAVAGIGPTAALVAPVVGPAFHPSTSQAEGAETRRRLSLPADRRLALIVAGSWGVGDVEQTAFDVAASQLATPVVVCGRNEALRQRLQGGPAVALGWQDDMPTLLRAADVVVHNAGGLSSVEALATGVPVVSYRCLPGHGTANAAQLSRSGLSTWPVGSGQLTHALWHALHGDLREQQQAAYARLAEAPDAAILIAFLARRQRAAAVRTGVAASSGVGFETFHL
jgi:UDP-N-acetylglucosamine:LPS N-acetylglucosamine transferase